MPGLPLRELEAFPGAGPTWLLALDGARVPRQEPSRAKLVPVLRVRRDEGPRHAEAHRAGLPRLPASVHVRPDVEGTECVGCGERLLDVLDQRGPREVVAERAAVDVPLPGAGREIHAGDARLAPPHRLPPERRNCRHAVTLAGPRVKGLGCCAAWGCSAPAYTLSLPRSFCLASEFFGSMP